jgi:predicted nuclease with TOPRIM domain
MPRGYSVQSVAINDQKKQIDFLKEEVAELNAAFKKLLAGNRRKKYINPGQKLLEFPEHKELQAALEAAKREAEQEVEKITYTRTKQKKEAKPSDLVKKTDSLPAHLRREETVKSAPPPPTVNLQVFNLPSVSSINLPAATRSDGLRS